MSSARVLYIAGYGRSGSTVLDLLLGNNPGVFGAGELKDLFHAVESGASCSCGEACVDCVFWSSIIRRLQSQEGLASHGGTVLDSRVGWPWVVRNSNDCRVWRLVFEAISRQANAPVVVDSSKVTARTFWRLPRLKKCGMDILAIHLLRDPRAVMWSTQRGSNRLLEAGQQAGLRGGVARGLIGWIVSNILSEVCTWIRKIPVIRIRYEDLVCDPVAELRRIGAFAGVDVEPVISKVETGQSLSVGHGIGGNRLRRSGPVIVQADNEWRDGLSSRMAALALLAWPLARRYGYRWTSL